MRITKIEKQKNKKDRYSLYLNDQFWLGVHENIIVQFNLLKAQDVTQELLEAIVQAEYVQKIYSRAIHFLSRTLKSEKEVRDHLRKLIIEEQKEAVNLADFEDKAFAVVDETIAKLTSQKYIDDLFYAQSYVRTQMNLQAKGKQAIVQYLSKKGIAEELINEALEEFSDQAQGEIASVIAQKYIKSKRALLPKKVIEKVNLLLFQKGFSQSIIKDVVSQLAIDVDQDKVNQSLDKEAQKVIKKFGRKLQGYELKQKIIESLLRKGFEYQTIQHWIADNEENF